jgi:3,5-epimerase/4-reductase
MQMEKEFPEMLPIKESLIKYVFEPNAAKREETLKAVRAMRGR